MNERSQPFGAPNASDDREIIVLAREPDFRLGRLHVRPSRGEIDDEVVTKRVEPRVMQVLVALASRNGQTVAREELIDRCWGGVVVGKDAVNRAISQLRSLAEGTQGSFRIETLARIGYRLLAGDRAAGDPGEAALDVRIVAVLPFDSEGGPESGLLAYGVSEAILSGLTRNGGIAVAARHSSLQFRGERKVAAASALGASHLVDGSVVVEGDTLRVTAYLIDAARQLTLWSEQFEGGISRVFEVQDRIARRVVDTLDLRIGRGRSPGGVDALVNDLYTRALIALEQPAREPVDQALAYLTDAVGRAPRGRAWPRRSAAGCCTNRHHGRRRSGTRAAGPQSARWNWIRSSDRPTASWRTCCRGSGGGPRWNGCSIMASRPRRKVPSFATCTRSS